jgi:hypothetical protein
MHARSADILHFRQCSNCRHRSTSLKKARRVGSRRLDVSLLARIGQGDQPGGAAETGFSPPRWQENHIC